MVLSLLATSMVWLVTPLLSLMESLLLSLSIWNQILCILYVQCLPYASLFSYFLAAKFHIWQMGKGWNFYSTNWYCQVEFGINEILFSKFLSPSSRTVQWFIFYLVFFIVSLKPIIFQVKWIKEIICCAHFVKLSLRHSGISFRVVLSFLLFS